MNYNNFQYTTSSLIEANVICRGPTVIFMLWYIDDEIKINMLTVILISLSFSGLLPHSFITPSPKIIVSSLLNSKSFVGNGRQTGVILEESLKNYFIL